jgi:hypothetical protein
MDSLSTGLITVIVGTLLTQIITVIVTVFNSRSKDLKDLNKSVIRLTTQMEHVFHAIEDLPKIKKDNNEAHRMIREMKNDRSH